MNFYIIVEGKCTEMAVYPKWLRILAPSLTRVDNLSDISNHSYYLFSGGGIPSIYRHVVNAVAEQHITYTKRNPGDVCKPHYLQRIIERFEETGHIASFGRWYNFVKTVIRPSLPTL